MVDGLKVLTVMSERAREFEGLFKVSTSSTTWLQDVPPI